jgi:hypothetical protein
LQVDFGNDAHRHLSVDPLCRHTAGRRHIILDNFSWSVYWEGFRVCPSPLSFSRLMNERGRPRFPPPNFSRGR